MSLHNADPSDPRSVTYDDVTFSIDEPVRLMCTCHAGQNGHIRSFGEVLAVVVFDSGEDVRLPLHMVEKPEAGK